ncbi:hypothetical protein AGMMS49975_26480 [Clostridia bacterium]|nr:hypothetical protein AGMMS49975_26480 [Clostridia bacterium]
MVFICDQNFNPIYEIEQVKSCVVYESLDGLYTMAIKGLLNIDIQSGYTVKYNNDYFDIIHLEFAWENGYYVYSLDCEHISYRLNDAAFENFSQNAPPAAILQTLLNGTMLQVGQVDFDANANFISDTKTGRGLLMELSFQLHAYITYTGFSINLLQSRGNAAGKNADNYKFSHLSKFTDDETSFTARVFKLEDLEIGDRVIFNDDKLKITNADNLRIISIKSNLHALYDFSVELADYKFGEFNRRPSPESQYYDAKQYESSSGGGGGGGTTIANAVIIDDLAATNHIAEVQIDSEIEYYVGNFTTVPDKALLQYNFGASPPVFYAQGNGLTFQAGDSYALFGLTYILQEYNQIEMENGDKIDLKMEFVSLTTSSTTFMITSTRNGGVVGTYSLSVTSSPEDPIVNFGMSLGQTISGGYSVSGINSALAGASGVPVISLGSVVGSTSVTYPILPITIYTISQSGTVAKSAPRCGQWISPAANTNIKMSSDEYINALQIQSITVTSGWQTMATFS